MSKKIFILAGEPSGDLHGAALIEKLKAKLPDLKIYGIGGEKMIEAGLQAIFHIKDFSFLGFAEVIKHLPKIFALKKSVIKFIEEENIKTVLLIDYPGFNLNLAKTLKNKGVKVLYYISPQLWAWGSSRAKKMKNRIDKLFVIFQFEVEFFKQYGINAEFVGHPLIERIENYKFIPPEEFFKNYNLNENQDILLLMPGSRKHEIKLILPAIYNAAKKLKKDFNFQVVISASSNIELDYYKNFIDSDVKLIYGNTYELLKYSKFGLVKSGTSTLEAALFELPFIVLYKTGNITYWLGKRLVNIDSIALPNIVLGKKVVDELIQEDANEIKIYDTAKNILNDEKRMQTIKTNLSEVKNKLIAYNAKSDLVERVAEELI